MALCLNAKTTIKLVLPRHQFYEVSLKGEWGSEILSRRDLLFHKHDDVRAFVAEQGKEVIYPDDGFTDYQVDDNVVSVSNTCLECDPPIFTFKLNGNEVSWDVFDAHDFFRSQIYRPPRFLRDYNNRTQYMAALLFE
jgi:hypothetical protein